ncbi:MAG: thermonuclease family protein [Candidatus Aenigmarchaeota archaeon]|nr:thermonuclease family protein [Candidatus Aenigmarchaeota archaeon]
MDKRIIFLIALVLIIIIAFGISTTEKFLDQQKLAEKSGPFKVIKVIDGDTLTLENKRKVRLSGINTPETGECYYEEAKQRLTTLVLNKEIFLERDITDIDKYDRLLRYVYVDNISVNFLLVNESYAKVYDKYKDDTKYYEELKTLENLAKDKGVWLCNNPRSSCLYVGSKNSDVYHQANSTQANRINPENLVCFHSIEEAENAGYRPSTR